MKLNLPTILTNKKTSFLFLLILSNIKKIKTGEVFEECIGVYDNSSYNSLVKFPFASNNKINGGLWLEVCCNGTSCYPLVRSESCSSGYRIWPFSCRKVAETIFCKVYTGVFCGGVVGDSLITTNTTIGDCPNLDQFAIKTLENDTYYGEKTVYCQEITPCPIEVGFLSCYWDNNGWTCDEFFGTSCLLQWTNSSISSPTVSSTTSLDSETTVAPSHSASNSVTPLPTNHHLIGKITIPIGTIIGIATAGGVTYYIINRTTLNNILKSINNSLTLDQINAKINKLDQYRNAGRNIFKKIIWNYSKGENIYSRLIQQKSQLTVNADLDVAYQKIKDDIKDGIDNANLQIINTVLARLKPYRDAAENTPERNAWNTNVGVQNLYDELQTITLTDTDEEPILEQNSIGRGGFGEVYRGKWKSQEVAVKKLYPSPRDTSKTGIDAIKRETNILKSLRNKYIIQYYGTYSDDQKILIIMDYAENGTLKRLIDNNKNKVHDNWEISITELIKQMALGLTYIHHNNVIHRDLKSENILLTNNYQQVKISDFGLSKINNAFSSQTIGGAKGTLRWMAPELLKDIKNPKYSEKSDIYALGMIIWEIVSKCTTPFKGIENLHFYIMNNGKETIPSDAPKDIQNIIQQCWKDNTEERIVLENMLKIIRVDESELQTINSCEKSSDNENLSESQNSKEVNKMPYEISQSMKFNPDEFDNILEKNSQEKSSSSINISNNKNIHPTDLEDKKSTGINTNSTKVKRRISYHQNNSNYDLAGFQAQEEQQLQQTQTEQPPK